MTYRDCAARRIIFAATYCCCFFAYVRVFGCSGISQDDVALGTVYLGRVEVGKRSGHTITVKGFPAGAVRAIDSSEGCVVSAPAVWRVSSQGETAIRIFVRAPPIEKVEHWAIGFRFRSGPPAHLNVFAEARRYLPLEVRLPCSRLRGTSVAEFCIEASEFSGISGCVFDTRYFDVSWHNVSSAPGRVQVVVVQRRELPVGRFSKELVFRFRNGDSRAVTIHGNVTL